MSARSNQGYSQTTVKETNVKNLHLIIDAGNSAIKATLVEGTTVLETETIPSLLRYDDNCLFVMGGFRFSSEKSGCIVGWDNEGKENVLRIGDEDSGKIEYLPELLAACVSVFVSHFSNASVSLRVTVLTLQLQHRDLIAEAVGRLAEVEVDGQKLSIKPELADVLPESFGCSSFAAAAFPDCPTVAVFDLGSGTANVSTYKVSGGLPRRKYFEFMPIGINTLVDKIASELKAQSSNGRVKRDLIRFALTTNRYTLGYSGRSIETEVDKAIVSWLSLPEFTTYLNQLTAYLDSGIPVTACGGGWSGVG